jgi:hypothetical protein
MLSKDDFKKFLELNKMIEDVTIEKAKEAGKFYEGSTFDHFEICGDIIEAYIEHPSACGCCSGDMNYYSFCEDDFEN